MNHYKYICILISLMIIAFSAKAQLIDGGGVDPTGFGGIKKADEAYNNLKYADAIPIYKAYLKKNETDADAFAKLGDCYRLTLDFENAKNAYENATKNSVNNADYALKYAQMLQATGNYDQALAQYQKYIALGGNESQIASNQVNALQHLENYKSKNRFTVTDLSFNSPQYDFSPTLYKQGLIYASSKDEKAIQKVSSWTGTSFFDMFYIEGSNSDFDKRTEIFFNDKNTRLHDGVIAFLPNQEQFYYTRNNFIDQKVKTAKDFKPTQNLYLNTIADDTEIPFEFNSDDYNVGHPTLTTDGNTMYFVSDMPGGFGGKDIYVTTKEDGKWSTPKNMGDKINTAGDEMFPFIYKDDQSFYFASNGHGGLGGLDVFRTTIENGSVTTKVRNMESPVNSSYDDFGLIYGINKQVGYFTSNRTGGKGLDDIYAFKDAGIYYEGIVLDADTKQPICASTVELLLEKEAIDNYLTECDGDFIFDVTASGDYCFNASAKGYYANNSKCRTIEDMTAGETIRDTIYLSKVKPAAVTVKVSDEATKLVIPNAKVTIYNTCEKKFDSIITNIKGEVCFEVRCDCEYNLTVSAENYTSVRKVYIPKEDCKSLKTCGDNNGKVIPIELHIVKVEDLFDEVSEDGYIALKNIYYDLDKWFLRSESIVELEKLLTFLKANPKAVVEIASHTDSRASHQYNQELSQKRAQSVVDWLVEHNISKDRLIAKGYGETKLVNKCADGVKCTEAEHQLNRRTEFKVISNDQVIESEP